MVQIYSVGDSLIGHSGDFLPGITSAKVTTTLNGEWNAEITATIDEDERWKAIQEGAIFRLSTWQVAPQLYRVESVQITADEITAIAHPIAYDLASDPFITDRRFSNMTPQDIMTNILTGTDFLCFSNVMTRKTAYYMDKSAFEVIAGSDDNSILNRWGGDIIFDNYTVWQYADAGANHVPLILRYGQNIQGITQTTSLEGVLTRVYPRAYNGKKYTGGSGYIDAPNIPYTVRPVPRAGAVTFDDVRLAEDVLTDEELPAGVTVCEDQTELNAALLARTQALFDDGLAVPSVTIELDGYVDLSDYPEYDDLITQCFLGYRVYIVHPNVPGDTAGKITEIVYDALAEQVIGLTVTPTGRSATNALNKMAAVTAAAANVLTADGAVKASELSGQVDLRKAGSYAGYTPSTQSSIPAVLIENTDPTAAGYGAVALGADGIAAASERTPDFEWDLKPGYTGTVTINGQTLEFKHGILTNVT